MLNDILKSVLPATTNGVTRSIYRNIDLELPTQPATQLSPADSASSASVAVRKVVPLITASQVAPRSYPIQPMPVIAEVAPLVPMTRAQMVTNQADDQEWLLSEMPAPGERHVLPLPYPTATETLPIIEADPINLDDQETRVMQTPVSPSFEAWINEKYPQDKKRSGWETILGRMFGGKRTHRGNA